MSAATSDIRSGAVAATSGKFDTWRICAWAGPVFLAGFIVSWGILGYNIPPIDPGMALADLQAHYVEHSVRLRAAMGLCLFFGPLYFVFSALLSRFLQKIEGADGPLAVIEQMGGAVTTVVLLVGGVSWLTAAFRVNERTAEGIRQLHDFGWMFFDTTYMATSLQMAAVGLVLLRDKRSLPLFPRWLAWFSFFCAAVFVPITLMPYFLDGPFAWNGAFNYWVGFNCFFLWMALFSYFSFGAISKLEQEEASNR